MKWIPLAPIKIPPKNDKLADTIAQCNPKIYDGKYDPVGLEEWIQGIEEIFTVVEVLEDKKVNIRTFYLTVEADIWWKVVKDMLLGHDFT